MWEYGVPRGASAGELKQENGIVGAVGAPGGISAG